MLNKLLYRMISFLLIGTFLGFLPDIFVPDSFLKVARAELWQGAETLYPGETSVGAFAQVLNQSGAADRTAFGSFVLGLRPNLQLEARLGYGTPGTYAGFSLKENLFQTDRFGLAVLGGIHYQSQLVWDVDFIGSLRWDRFEIYSSLYLYLPVWDAAMGVGWIPGISFKVSQTLTVYLEGDVNLVDYFKGGSLGLRYFF